MTKIVEDVAHLSEHIGPRPAGTEEEQQAALYIASELQQGAGFSAVIEDFSCLSSATIVRTICFAAGFIAALVSLFLPVLALPACILGIIAAVVYVLEATGKEVISRFFHTGISQNVVAQYKPAQKANAPRSRKVILVANYDSAKEDKKYQSPLTNILGKLRLAVFAGLIASPVIIFIRTVFFMNTVGGIVVFLNILTVVCLILMALPLIDIVLLRFAAYNQAANNNASGVGVLLETARTIGNGLVDSDDLEAKAHEEGAVVHGKEAAQSAGVVPEGVEIEYEAAQHNVSPEESLAAAKAAIAALTGKPVADKVPITDISSRLVKVGEPADAEAANVHFEVDKTTTQQPMTSGLAASRISVREQVPRGAQAEAGSGQRQEQAAAQEQAAVEGNPSAASAVSSRIVAGRAQASVSGLSAQAPQSAVAAVQTQGTQETSASFTRETPQALQSGQTGMATNIDKTPAWAKSAQAKAHANKPNLEENKKVSRSRFADAPAAHMSDANANQTHVDGAGAAYSATLEGAAADSTAAANSAESSHSHEQTPQKPMTELEARLAALHSEIAATEAPHLSDDAKAALERMGEQEQPEIQEVQEIQEQQKQVADQGKTQPQQRIVVEADAPSKVQQESEPTQQQRAQKQAEAASAATVAQETKETHGASEPNKANEVRQTKEAQSSASRANAKPEEAKATEGKTQAIAPIDVSALLNKEAKEPKEPGDQQESQMASKPDEEQKTSELAPVKAEASLQSVEQRAARKPQAKQKSQPKTRAKAKQTAKQKSAQATQIMQAVQDNQTVKTAQDSDGAAAPIVGMDSISPLQSAQIPTIDIAQEHARASQPERQVIVLPDVANVPNATTEATQQRAPMAEVNDSAIQGSKALLSNMLPRISEGVPEGATSDESSESDTFGLDLPTLDDSNIVEHNTVSPTGSFSTIGGTGAFAPVGDDLVADVDPEEIYVDDADDSAYDQEFTQTGAFAGTGYVEMPKSRAGRLFGRFRSKKNKNQAEPSMSEWIDTDENYNARSVGKERGGWESFREDAEGEIDSASNDAQFIDVDYSDNSFDKFRDWNGGAFSLDRLRRGIASQRGEDVDDEVSEADDEIGFEEDNVGEEHYFATSPSAATASSAQTFNEAAQINQELQKLKHFRYPGIDTEVWFVALGAENAGHSGMQAFINEHESELKGAIFVDLEALGAGRLSLIEKEGLVKPKTISSRIKRIVRAASEKSGVPVASVLVENRDTTARYAAARGYQSLTLMGMEQGQAAFYGSRDDTIDNIDQQTLEENASFVMAILKSI